jgi:succinyl-CoA synthetase beta subunit
VFADVKNTMAMSAMDIVMPLFMEPAVISDVGAIDIAEEVVDVVDAIVVDAIGIPDISMV